MRLRERSGLGVDALTDARELDAQGHMSTVYRATYHGAPAVVKVAERDARTEREVRLMRAMGEASVGPRVLHVAHRRGVAVVVMDALDGTLEAWLASNPPAAERAAARRSVRTLFARMHALGLAHADVHAANVMYQAGPRRRWYLIDYGWAHGMRGSRHFPRWPDVDYPIGEAGDYDDDLEAWLDETFS